MRSPTAAIVVLVLIGFLSQGRIFADVDIKPDEHVLFFPTAAWQTENDKDWEIPIHGWVFEPEKDDLIRRLLIRQLGQSLSVLSGQSSNDTFEQRLGNFLRDSERGKHVRIRLGPHVFQLAASGQDGHFRDRIVVPARTIKGIEAKGWLTFRAILPEGDLREFSGAAMLVKPQGLSVISDIDDTFKFTEVVDKRKLLANTFLHPFRPVEGMTDVYRRWSEHGAVFHFVSLSPWQLYEPLSRFARDGGFPQASYHLRNLHLEGFAFAEVFADGEATKLPVINDLMSRYPERPFVLVGDSGQRDPEVYGIVARQRPKQVAHVYIRDVTDQERDSPRYKSAFADVPCERWDVFRDPIELTLPAQR